MILEASCFVLLQEQQQHPPSYSSLSKTCPNVREEWREPEGGMQHRLARRCSASHGGPTVGWARGLSLAASLLPHGRSPSPGAGTPSLQLGGSRNISLALTLPVLFGSSCLGQLWSSGWVVHAQEEADP